jgi:hypothetical protein
VTLGQQDTFRGRLARIGKGFKPKYIKNGGRNKKCFICLKIGGGSKKTMTIFIKYFKSVTRIK